MANRKPLKVLFEGADGVGKGCLIQKVEESLTKLGLKVSVINTTAKQNANPEVRQKLVSPDSSEVERFTAALALYYGGEEWIFNEDSLDVVLYDRGWSGFLVYNKIPWMNTTIQSLMIPDVDVPILVTAPFDQLTARIAARNGSNFVSFQDSNLEYRQEVYRKYEEYFRTLSELRAKPYKILQNTDGHLDQVSYEAVTHILTQLGHNGSEIPC